MTANPGKSRYFPNNRTQCSVDGIFSRLSLLIVEVKPRSRKAGRRIDAGLEVDDQ
jgi:hypothetical protein